MDNAAHDEDWTQRACIAEAAWTGMQRALDDMLVLIDAAQPDPSVKLTVLRSGVCDALAGKYPTGDEDHQAGIGHCGRCGDEVLWIKTAAGKNMPCDQRRRVVTTEDGRSVTGYESHFATCRRGARSATKEGT